MGRTVNRAAHRLLVRADILVSAYTRALWFGNAQYVPPVLWVPTQDHCDLVTRNFLPALRTVDPSLEVRIGQPETPLPKPKPVNWQFHDWPKPRLDGL